MLMANCGYTYEYIDHHMTMPKLDALLKYWSQVPPMDVILAGLALALGFDWRKTSADSDAELLAKAKAEAAYLNAGMKG